MAGRAGRIGNRAPRAAARLVVAARVLAALLMFAGTLRAAHAATGDELEYPVKAEFIERFTHFIDWPQSAFAGPDAPFILCVIGETPLGPYLDRLAQHRRIKGRAVQLRRVKANADLSQCHLVFIAADERAHLKQILARVEGRPIVTVADSQGFGRAGVLINLNLDAEGRVGFEISSASAKHTALTLNAQLLKLSRLSPGEDGR
jgi:hypothetical protein